MKKILMTVALMVVAVAASAQIYVGGSLGLSSTKAGYLDGTEEPDAYTQFHINPEVGYNLSDDLSVGIGLGYAYGKQGDRKTTSFEIAPYARWTFVRWSKVSLFLEGGLSYSFDKEKVEEEHGNVTVSEETKTGSFKIGVRPGLRVDLTDHIALMTRVGWLGYECIIPDGDDMNNGSRVGFDVSGENLTFGFLYTF